MKYLGHPPQVLIALITLALATASEAGSLGAGPWANGAYYPGQFDGTYTATIYADPGTTNVPVTSGSVVYSGTVVSGVVGFALTAGSPRTDATGLVVDNTKNYYAIFADGYSYVGVTYANVDIAQKTVAGTFAASVTEFVNPPFVERYMNGGSFIADITSDSAVVSFSGSGFLSTSTSPMNTTKPVRWTDGTQFGITGLKVAN